MVAYVYTSDKFDHFRIFFTKYFALAITFESMLLVLGLGLGVDFTFAWDNNNNDKNPHLNFLKGIVIGFKKQGVGIRDKG